jgi:hypothetical protein
MEILVAFRILCAVRCVAAEHTYYTLHRLQGIRNILARVVAGPFTSSAYLSSSDILYHLHWLPIDLRVKFKLAKLAFTSCSSSSPPYLASLVSPCTPSRNIRSSNTHLLTVPEYRLQIAKRGLREAAPTLFNSLRLDVTTATSLSVLLPILKLLISSPHFPPSNRDVHIAGGLQGL